MSKGGLKGYTPRALARLSLEGVLNVIDQLSTMKVPLGGDKRTGWYNSRLRAYDQLWKMCGGDASLLSEEGRKTALERLQGLWGDQVCPKCGYREGKDEEGKR